ncbi:hypothetical protein HDU97_002459 [Phlyctochytrium planicorne]|nr:hypothetical protein HDU97_002459 [Phlyctochytrium planicorne]
MDVLSLSWLLRAATACFLSVLLLPCVKAQIVLPIGIILPLDDPQLGSTAQNVLNLTLFDLNNPTEYSAKVYHPMLQYRLIYRNVGGIGAATEAAVGMAYANGTDSVVGVVGDLTSDRVQPEALALNVFKYLFRIVPSDIVQGSSLAMLVASYGWSKVALITSNTAYGFGVASNILEKAETHNITIVRNEAYNPGDVDFHLQMASLIDADARIIVLVGYDVDAVNILREARRFGLIGRDYVWIGSDRVQTVYDLLYNPRTSSNYTDQDRQNAEGMILLSRTTRGGLPWDQFTQRYSNIFGPSAKALNDMSFLLRDCLMTFGAGFKNMVDSGIPLENIRNRTSGLDAGDFTSSVAFSGVSGNVEFSDVADRKGIFIFTNIVNGTLQTCLTIDSNFKFTTFTSPTFYGNSTVPPADGKILIREFISLNSGYGLFLMIMITFGLLKIAVATIVLIVRRSTSPVRNMSLPFLMIQAMGITLAYLALYSYIANARTSTDCMMQLWSQWMAFTLFLQGILPKLYRIFIVFENRTLIKKTNHLGDQNLLVFSLPIPVTSIIILTTWTIHDPVQPTRVVDFPRGTYHMECVSTHQSIYSNLMIAYMAALFLASMMLAYWTRRVHGAYKESMYILYAVQNSLLCMVLALGIYYSKGGAYISTISVWITISIIASYFVFGVTVGRAAYLTFVNTTSSRINSSSTNSHAVTLSRNMMSTNATSSQGSGQGSMADENGIAAGASEEEEMGALGLKTNSDGNRYVSLPVKVGIVSLFNDDMIQQSSQRHPDCAILRMGTMSCKDSTLIILQFKNGSARSEFLALIARTPPPMRESAMLSQVPFLSQSSSAQKP